MKLLVLPDIHGRKFWKQPCEHIDDYEKVIFLGDYFDPYRHEHITFQEAIDNFNEIIELKQHNMEKVVLLLGNHDLPYFSKDYYRFLSYHSRHSNEYHAQIAALFEDNRDFFKIAHVEDDVLFTHAGVDIGWLRLTVKCESTDITEIANQLNSLIETSQGFAKLAFVSWSRGGNDKYASCVWTDVQDMMHSTSFPIEDNPIKNLKQVFGHTLQAYYAKDNMTVLYGKAIEFDNCKMLDNAEAYELDTESFTIKQI